MSDKPISVGDLVMVVRGHSCDIGATFTVSFISTWPHGWKCSCGVYDASYIGPIAYRENDNEGQRIYPLSWLLRIDPPAIPESERTTNGEKEKV